MNKLFVSKPSLAPLSEYTKHLEELWNSGILTHHGPKVQELEKNLEEKLSLPSRSLISCTNGTIAIQMALRALEISGSGKEVLTTPFSWASTCNTISWEGAKPVFCDIDEKTFNIDPKEIEKKITPNTTAIMPVHVFSNPCNLEEIQDIARKYKLKLIYDGAHTFGVKTKRGPLTLEGDISTLSFHATKLFNTGEGGACITNNPKLARKLERIRFFGHNENKEIVEDGFNAKMTELHAALGLVNLKLYEEVLEHRIFLHKAYKEGLKDLERISFQSFNQDEYNYCYMPIVLQTQDLAQKILKNLADHYIFARQYFHPSLNEIEVFGTYTPCPHSESLSRRILCLPSHSEVNKEHVEQICKIIQGVLDK